MRQIVLESKYGIENLTERAAEKPVVGSDEVLVHMKAAALNYVDLAIVEGKLSSNLPLPLIPVADGAGIIDTVGPDVRGFNVGELVSTLYIPRWQSGRYLAEHTKLEIRPGAGHVAGQLSEYKVFKPDEIIHAPEHLSPSEAATFPIAALTAWNALIYGNIKPGDTVLVHGTGGVSIFALQFAKVFGARVVVTSSSDEKLAKAAKLGADLTVNYKTTPDLTHQIMQMTENEGIALVVETVGGDSLSKSLAVLKPQGHMSVVGFLAGTGANINLIELNLKRATMTGISVGNTEDFKDMLTAVAQHGLKPVIDSTYPLEKAAEAFRQIKGGFHFGKIVITL
jgi:NADPH:quinone reductase-like Zn-dependent oxidoreductase